MITEILDHLLETSVKSMKSSILFFYSSNIYCYRNPFKFRNMSRKIHAAAKKICFVKTDNVYLNWKEYVDKMKGTKLYGAKVDVRDAYGNMNIGKSYICSYQIIITIHKFSTK